MPIAAEDLGHGAAEQRGGFAPPSVRTPVTAACRLCRVWLSYSPYVPAGGISTAILWPALDDEAFERLLFDHFRGFQSYQNVDWLMKTRAPDRGRDLSAERVNRDDGGTTRIERVVIQAKHWTSKSVAPIDIQTAMAALSTWEPPVVRGLLVATSGRFTSDAVAVVDKHNADGKTPFIELWPDSRLETLLSERPDLIATYALRSVSSD